MKIFDDDYEYQITFRGFNGPSQLADFVNSTHIKQNQFVSITEYSGGITMYYWDLILQKK